MRDRLDVLKSRYRELLNREQQATELWERAVERLREVKIAFAHDAQGSPGIVFSIEPEVSVGIYSKYASDSDEPVNLEVGDSLLAAEQLVASTTAQGEKFKKIAEKQFWKWMRSE